VTPPPRFERPNLAGKSARQVSGVSVQYFEDDTARVGPYDTGVSTEVFGGNEGLN